MPKESEVYGPEGDGPYSTSKAVDPHPMVFQFNAAVEKPMADAVNVLTVGQAFSTVIWSIAISNPNSLVALSATLTLGLPA